MACFQTDYIGDRQMADKRKVLQLLAKLADTTNYSSGINALMAKQDAQVQEAFGQNSPGMLKSLLSKQKHYANETKVVELS